MTTLPALLLRLLVCAAFLHVAGCTRELTPEELQADQLLRQAKESYAMGKYHETRDRLRSAIDVNRRLGRTRHTAEGLELLGRLYGSSAEFDSALFYISSAVEHYRQVADRSSVRALTLESASIHSLMGDERRSFDIYTEALRLARVFKEDDGVREIQWAMLPTIRALGKTGLEAETVTDLMTAYTATGDTRQLARVHLESGATKRARQQQKAALEDFLRALTFSEQARDSLLAIEALLQTARAYEDMGNLNEAFDTFTDALRRSDVTGGAERLREEMLVQVGNIYMRRAQPGEALRFYRAALTSAIKRGDRIGEGYLFIQVGHCELAQPGTREQGMRSLRAALDLFNEITLPQGIAYAHGTLGYASLITNQPVQAIDHLKKAVDHHERSFLRRSNDDLYVECEEILFRVAGASYYDILIEHLLQIGRHDEAFWYMGRKLGKEMFDILSSWELTTHRPELTDALTSFRRARGMREGTERQLARNASVSRGEPELIGAIQARMNPPAHDMAASAERVIALDPSFEPAVRVRALTTAEVQKLLPQRTVLLSHFAGRRTLHVVAITPSRSAVQVAAIDRERITLLTEELASLLRHRESYTDSSIAHQRTVDNRIRELRIALYGFVVRPVEREIADAAQVIVVPQSGLVALPVHALGRLSGRVGGRAVESLIEQHSVSYLPLPTALAFSSKVMKAERTVTGFGHPGDTGWDVEYELRDIRAFYREAKLHFHQQATLTAMQRDSADVLHVALAFRNTTGSPATMHVLLSDGKSIATTAEVQLGQLFSLRRHPAVIISNLDGSARIERSIALLFLMRGSDVVVMSQYPPTRKTRKFFGEMFYTSLLGGADGRWAFRATQLEMIKNQEYASVHLWAPYTVWGK